MTRYSISVCATNIKSQINDISRIRDTLPQRKRSYTLMCIGVRRNSHHEENTFDEFSFIRDDKFVEFFFLTDLSLFKRNLELYTELMSNLV